MLAVPLIMERGSGQKSGLNTEQSTLNILANEFKKLNPPKLQKLKGGTSPSAQLFFLGWVKELKAIIKDCDLTDSESIQLVREFTENKARQPDLDVQFKMSKEISLQFSSGEDAGIKSEFYSREQLPKELRMTCRRARKILIITQIFQNVIVTTNLQVGYVMT